MFCLFAFAYYLCTAFGNKFPTAPLKLFGNRKQI